MGGAGEAGKPCWNAEGREKGVWVWWVGVGGRERTRVTMEKRGCRNRRAGVWWERKAGGRVGGGRVGGGKSERMHPGAVTFVATDETNALQFGIAGFP